jgi:hypothetical protein
MFRGIDEPRLNLLGLVRRAEDSGGKKISKAKRGPIRGRNGLNERGK